MRTRSFQLMAFTLVIFILSGCGKKVTRIGTDTTTDLSGKWNDTDSRLVAQEMVEDCFTRPWYSKYRGRSSIPRVIVGDVRNRSHEHINTQTFTKDIERALINSGRVEFVADKNERVQLREEKADQMAGNASEETMKMAGREAGADLMLLGSINTIVDQEGRRAVKFYQVNMELIEIESNRKLWIGQKKIKKDIKRANVKP